MSRESQPTEPTTAPCSCSSNCAAGLRERMGILFGVSWEYFRSGPSSAGSQPFGRPNRFAAALTGLALFVSAVAPSASLGVTYDPATDPYSMANTTNWTGAAAWWQAGYTGNGVDVAVIDTGVSPVEGLASPGKVVYGPDLSLESQADAFRNVDTNGHGTFMAGLIAGRDSGPDPALCRGSAVGLSGHCARCPHREHQGRGRGRRRRCLAGDRGHRLGGPEPLRQRHEHPRHQPVVRDELDAVLSPRSARVCRGAGVAAGHRRRGGGREQRIPEGIWRTGPREPRLQPDSDRRLAARTRWAHRARGTTRSPTSRPSPPMGEPESRTSSLPERTCRACASPTRTLI